MHLCIWLPISEEHASVVAAYDFSQTPYIQIFYVKCNTDIQRHFYSYFELNPINTSVAGLPYSQSKATASKRKTKTKKWTQIGCLPFEEHGKSNESAFDRRVDEALVHSSLCWQQNSQCCCIVQSALESMFRYFHCDQCVIYKVFYSIPEQHSCHM